MKSSDILSFTTRLSQGDNPADVFTEIEIFYVIRGLLNDLDPGECRHALDEYDSEAQHLLTYIVTAHDSDKVVTSDELADYLEEYFFKQFGHILTSNLRHFAYGLFQEILILRSHKIRGKDLSRILKLSVWQD